MNASFEYASLREVTERTQLWNPERGQRDRIRYIDVSAVSRENLSIRAVVEHDVSVAPSRARKVVRAGDTVFATVRPGLKRIAKVPQTLDDSIASTAFCVLRPKLERIDPDFLFFAVSADSFVRDVASLETGASYPAVRDSDVLDQQIPLPSLSEQKQIATVLAAVRGSLGHNANSLSHASVLKRAAMRELLTRGLRGEAQKETAIGPLPESWDVIPLGSLGRVGNGSTPKRGIPAYWTGGTHPWLTSAKVYDREIVAADQFVTEAALDECHLPRIRPGAVLIAITGQGKTLGHCAVLRFEATINQHIAYVAVDTERADPSFVRGYLETQYEYLRQVGSGGGSTKGALTCGFLRDLPIPQTDIGEQREIVAILDAIDKKIDLHKRKRTVLEDLFKSLLHKLMTGEIRVSDLDLSALATPTADEATA